MVQWLTVLVIFPEDMGSIPNIYVAAQNYVLFQLRGLLLPPLASVGTACT